MGFVPEITRYFEVISRGLAIALAEFKLAKRRVVERIINQPIAISDRPNLIQAPPCTFALCDCNGTIERDDR
jgi:hypothetical protein